MDTQKSRYSSPVDHRSLDDLWPQITRWSVHKYIHNVTKVMCALSVLRKECRKVSGARYRSENTVFVQHKIILYTAIKFLQDIWLYRERARGNVCVCMCARVCSTHTMIWASCQLVRVVVLHERSYCLVLSVLCVMMLLNSKFSIDRCLYYFVLVTDNKVLIT